MKKGLFALLFVFCYIECRKTYAPIDKNANLDFINMEAGGLGGRANKPGSPIVAPAAKPAPLQPAPVQPPKPVQVQPAVNPTPVKPTPVQPAPVKPSPVPPAKPAAQPTPAKPVPVYPTPATHPITTPGPGSVKSLVNFYDSQGKASVIRPYSYSQAVKQG